MSDSIKYDDDFFADSEPAQRKEKTKAAPAIKLPAGMNPEMLMKIIIGAVAVAAVIIIVLVGLIIGSKLGKDDNNVNGDGETTTISSSDSATLPSVGAYTVTVASGGALNLRENASMEANAPITIPSGTNVTVTEVKEAESIIWGKVTYNNVSGWVNMTYLTKAYTGTEVTPEQTTAAPTEEQSTAKTENTTTESTTAPTENTTTPSKKPTDSTANKGVNGATGKYNVNAQPSLHIREDHSVYGESIAQIPDGAEVVVFEVYHDASSDSVYTKYWGKVTYQGITGWVAMGYLN